MKFECGFYDRKKLTGAGLSVLVFQTASLFPLPYIFAVNGYPSVITGKNIVSLLFDTGIMTVPRWEMLLLSFLFRRFTGELAVYFTLLGIALVFGLIAGKMLKSEHRTAAVFRKILIVMTGIDLIIRLLPLQFNTAFGLPCGVIGFLVRLACFVLIIMDFHAYRKEQN